MTEYEIHGADHLDGWVRIWLKVGKRDKLQTITLERKAAWRLMHQIASALEVTE